MAVLKKVTHVLFDMDGLLLDTESFYTEVTQKIVGRYGKTFDWTLKAKMIGKVSIDAARILVDSLELPMTPEEYLEECESSLKELFPFTKPLPGAIEITKHLNYHNVPLGVATSSCQSLFELKISRHKQWFSLFDCIITANSPGVKNGKPAPDIFLAAANKMGARPGECLVFEDAPAGVEAALNAGMNVVVVPDPHMDKSIYSPGAHQIIENLYEFRPETWGMAPFPTM